MPISGFVARSSVVRTRLRSNMFPVAAALSREIPSSFDGRTPREPMAARVSDRTSQLHCATFRSHRSLCDSLVELPIQSCPSTCHVDWCSDRIPGGYSDPSNAVRVKKASALRSSSAPQLALGTQGAELSFTSSGIAHMPRSSSCPATKRRRCITFSLPCDHSASCCHVLCPRSPTSREQSKDPHHWLVQ